MNLVSQEPPNPTLARLSRLTDAIEKVENIDVTLRVSNFFSIVKTPRLGSVPKRWPGVLKRFFESSRHEAAVHAYVVVSVRHIVNAWELRIRPLKVASINSGGTVRNGPYAPQINSPVTLDKMMRYPRCRKRGGLWLIKVKSSHMILNDKFLAW